MGVQSLAKKASIWRYYRLTIDSVHRFFFPKNCNVRLTVSASTHNIKYIIRPSFTFTFTFTRSIWSPASFTFTLVGMDFGSVCHSAFPFLSDSDSNSHDILLCYGWVFTFTCLFFLFSKRMSFLEAIKRH